jgi:hypothetical protein
MATQEREKEQASGWMATGGRGEGASVGMTPYADFTVFALLASLHTATDGS